MRTLAAPPSELRAILAGQGPWSGELEALDLALDEMARRAIRADLAVVWVGGPDLSRAIRHVLVVGDGGIVTGTLTVSGAATRWFLPAD